MSTAIVWFRRDLRLADNPALATALANHQHILPIYIHAPNEEAPWSPGAASNWWLHHALVDLSDQLGGRLLILRGPSLETLRDLMAVCDADALYWNRLYEPSAIARDTQIKQALRAAGIRADSFNAALLFEPWEVSNRQGGPFRVFTPYWRHLLNEGLPTVKVAAPLLQDRCVNLHNRIEGVQLEGLGLLPKKRWDAGIAAAWEATRAAAIARLDEFLGAGLARYADGRDRPADDWVSRLSPYLHFGQLGPREVVAATSTGTPGASDFLRELGWREFAHHQLYHFPHTSDEPMDTRFERFPWRAANDELRAWQRGETGIPLVDAGMRQLWETGWMHNRVRMVVASFLTKNLLVHWHDGAQWFWDTLVDADLASNSLGWQWTAGSGADAAPYFRVFNPVLQGQKFDKAGRYVRRWLPELKQLPDKWVHQPWAAPDEVRRSSDLRLGDNYPYPLVDLKASRQRALDAWGAIK